MIPFDYVRAATLAGLLEGLRSAKGEGAILAGGTDLHVKMRLGHKSPTVLFDISELAPARAIVEDDANLRIGACVTMAELCCSNPVARLAPSLAAAARAMSCRQIRNRATLGGNIITASPAADSVPPLLAADARVLLVGPAGERELALGEFLLGPGKTALAPGEVLLEVLIGKPAKSAKPGSDRRSLFLKVGRRRAQAISVISLAGEMDLGPDGGIVAARIALGAVAPTVMRARRAEQSLAGKPASTANLQAAAAAAAAECSPISDVRASGAGRRLLVEGWTLRLLQRLCAQPGGTPGGHQS